MAVYAGEQQSRRGVKIRFLEMNNHAFATLEFDSLRTLVRRWAQTDIGRARIELLSPIDDLEELRRALRAVAESAELRQRGARLSFDGVEDPTDKISRLKIEGTALEPLAILNLTHLCERAIDARAAILGEREVCPTLFALVAALPQELTRLSAAVAKKILPNGELDDRASPELARIRHDIARARSRITRTLENLMRRSSEAIQEELVTVRNDRFVIPVRADHRGRINGVAHGSSSSGATIFVEPLETIEANNELQSLREAEQREIGEILFALSDDLRRQLPAIEQAGNAVAELDFIGAKAEFAEKFNCVVPQIGTEPRLVAVASGFSQAEDGTSAASKQDAGSALELLDARHPLLEENLRAREGAVVPISFQLAGETTTMVISGANAGGKTVVLKTAGLLSLMALSGLPVPASAARVPFYRSVLADIGDHQSLAANLSTFTSHVANIGLMIESCETPALVLLDEVGTGTDPEEGSALGVAVVDHFKHRGAHVLATTHYSGLKMYAAAEPGVLNASVEFDEKTLHPTYRLLVGIAGSSSGLEIARRFGIPGEVIQNATAQVKESSRDAAEYLRRIKREAEAAEALRVALEEERAAVAEKFASLDKQAQKREGERRADFERELTRALAQFEERAREMTARIEDRASRLKLEREAQKHAAELKREVQRAAQESGKRAQVKQSQGKEGGLPPHLRGVRVVRDGKLIQSGTTATPEIGIVEKALDESESARRGGRDVRAPSELRAPRVGDRVRLRMFGSEGIIDQIKDDEVEVRVGSLRMREKLENLELVDEVGTVSGSGVSTARVSGRVKQSLEDTRRQAQTTEIHLHSKDARSESSARSELNLIGKRTDEAVELADKFLDEAFLNALSEVRIIHGHGTGALRRAIAELLAGHPHVERFASAPVDQGGAGATIAELRN